MPNIKPPEGMQINALREKKVEYVDLMTPGGSTPWEERGSIGTIPAFIKTTILSITNPLKLTNQIRRPETAADSNLYVLFCGVFWAISWAIHAFISYNRHKDGRDIEPHPDLFYIGTGIQMLAGFAAPLLLLKVYCALYNRMVATELSKKAPPILTFNVKAYCLGPSVLSVIPFAGPFIALLLIVINFCRIGIKRLRLTASGTIIATIISMIVVSAIFTAVYYIGQFGWFYLTGGALQVIERLHDKL